MRKGIIRVAAVLLGFVIIWILLYLTSIYSNSYPNSSDIQIGYPRISSFFENTFGHKRDCKNLYWSFDAQTNDTSKQVTQYYSQKWKREPSPGGNASGFTWDDFELFRIQNTSISIYAFRQVRYPDLYAVPLKYGIKTQINFCKLDN